MKNDNNRKAGFIFSAIGIIPVVLLALLTAPYVSGGLVEIIRNLPTAINNPFQITVCEDSVKTVLIFLLAYGMGRKSDHRHEHLWEKHRAQRELFDQLSNIGA